MKKKKLKLIAKKSSKGRQTNWRLLYIKFLCKYGLFKIRHGNIRIISAVLVGLILSHTVLLIAFGNSATAMVNTNAANLKGTQVSGGGTDLNVSSKTALSWNSSQEYDATYFSYSGTNNTRLTIEADGDYFFSVTVPVTSDAFENQERNNIEAEIRVNGTKRDIGVGRSGYIRNNAGHLEASTHLTGLLVNLSENDYVEVFIINKTTNTSNTLTSDTHALYSEYVENESIYFGTGTETTNSTNFNQSTAYEMEWSTDARVDSDYSRNISTTPEDITLIGSGSYFVSVNIPLGSTAARANIKGKVLLDGTQITGGLFQQGYIKNSQSHADSSIHYSGIVTSTSANQDVSISVEQEAISGTVTVDSEDANIYIQKLPDKGVYFGQGTTVTDTSGPNRFNPPSPADIKWTVDDIIDDTTYSHSDNNNSHEITLNRDGDYMVALNGAYANASCTERCAPKATVRVNGSLAGGAEAKSAYIRNLDNHTDSSNTLLVMLENLSAGDEISVRMEEGGASGHVADQAPSTLLVWRKNLSPGLTQSTYRWYKNNDNVQPGGFLEDEANPLTLHASSPFLSEGNFSDVRLRMGLTAGGLDIPSASEDFKLQYAEADGLNNWWDSNWTNRRKITFDNSDSNEDLVDFPILIKLNFSRIDYSKTQNSGQDIRFTDSDGTTLLDYEIEDWNESGNSFMWVRVPRIESNSTDDGIYMYYGNSGASDAQDVNGTWNNGFSGVWHFDETSGDHSDSTSNSNDTSTVSVNTQGSADGIANGSSDFDGTGDYVQIPTDSTLQFGTGDFTFTGWIYPRSVPNIGSSARIANNRGKGAGTFPGWQLAIDDSSGTWGFKNTNTRDSSGNGSGCGGGGSFCGPSNNSYHQWYHVAMSWDGSSDEARLYINGNQVHYHQAGATTGSISNSLDTVFGASRYNGGVLEAADQEFDGIIDEPRISNVVRSTDWIEAEHKVLSDSMNFYASDEEEYSAGNTIYENDWADVGGGSVLPADWYDSDWTSRREITLDNSASSENLTDFPILVKLNSSRIDYSNVQNNGQDLRFTDSDGTTLLDHEIELWDESGDSFVWVKVPQIDSGSTTDSIFMYYGNSGASDGQDVSGVWSNGYLGVWHLAEDPSISSDGICGGGSDEICDSTSNSYDGNMAGSMTNSDLIDAQIGKGHDFDGSNDSHTIDSGIEANSSSGISGRQNVTLSAWYKRDAPGDYIQVGRQDTNGYGGLLLEGWNDGDFFFHASSNTTNAYGYVAQNDSNWHHAVLAFDGSGTGNSGRLKGYIDGIEQTLTYNSAVPNLTAVNSEDFSIGKISDGTHSEGQHDEIRVSNVTRSADWIEADYLTMTDAMNTFGSEEVGTSCFGGGSMSAALVDSDVDVGSATVTITSGEVEEGDLLILAAQNDRNTSFLDDDPSAGTWTERLDQEANGEPHGGKLWTKTATSTDAGGTSYSVDSHASADVTLQLVAVSGNNPTVDESASATMATASTTETDVVAPSVTTTEGDALLFNIWSFFAEGSGSTTINEPGGSTELSYDLGNNGAMTSMGYESLASAGATGTRTATLSSAEFWTAMSIAVVDNISGEDNMTTRAIATADGVTDVDVSSGSVAEDEIMVLMAQADRPSNTISLNETGWTEIEATTASGGGGGGSDAGMKIWTKIATASEPSTYNVTAETGADIVLFLAGVASSEGANLSVDDSNISTASDTDVVAPSVTTTTDNTALIRLWSIFPVGGSGRSIGDPGSMNVLYNDTNSGDHVIAQTFYEDVTNSGSTGAASVTASHSEVWIAASIAIKSDFNGSVSSCSAKWNFRDNDTPADGATISSNLLSAATVLALYTESNPTATNPNTISSGSMAEWDFSLDGSNADPGEKYYFRLLPNGSTAEITYSTYPTITYTNPNEVPSQEQFLRGGGWFNDGIEQPKSF